ncbi:unnamed protein product, partial [Didymodactylos carnosus]
VDGLKQLTFDQALPEHIQKWVISTPLIQKPPDIELKEVIIEEESVNESEVIDPELVQKLINEPLRKAPRSKPKEPMENEKKSQLTSFPLRKNPSNDDTQQKKQKAKDEDAGTNTPHCFDKIYLEKNVEQRFSHINENNEISLDNQPIQQVDNTKPYPTITEQNYSENKIITMVNSEHDQTFNKEQCKLRFFFDYATVLIRRRTVSHASVKGERSSHFNLTDDIE